MNNLLQNIELSADDSIALFSLRENGRSSFEKIGLPNKKNENWKYVSLRALERQDYVIDTEGCDHSHCNHDKSALPFAAYEINMCNGKICHLPHDLPKGLVVCSLLDAFFEYDIKKKINARINLSENPFCALNTAYLEQGVYIEVAADTEIDRPVAVVHSAHCDDKNLLLNVHNIVVLKENAKLDLVEYYNHKGIIKSDYLLNIVNEITLGKGACLNHIKIQKDAFYANHIAYNSVVLKEEALYNGFCLQKGANIGRNETKAELIGKNAKFVLNGAYIMNGWALLNTVTDIRHLCSDTASEQMVRGVIDGKAHGVFLGKIHIAPDADRTEGKQLHKALLLSDEAEVDYKPELEIFADDVKCSHGATCGELDKEMLFYMKSRGIGEDEAKKMLIDAYLNETFDNILKEDQRQWIKDEL